MFTEVTAKAVGATIGSSLALIFRPNCTPFVLFQRFLVGVIFGFILAPIVIDYFGWKHTFDYWLASSTLTGALSYYVLNLIFSGTLIDKFLNKKK